MILSFKKTDQIKCNTAQHMTKEIQPFLPMVEYELFQSVTGLLVTDVMFRDRIRSWTPQTEAFCQGSK